MANKFDFLHSHSRYYGQVKPENLVFNTNLQEFAIAVGYICNLETAGKLSPEESYQKIHSLWQQLERGKTQLGIGEHSLESN